MEALLQSKGMEVTIYRLRFWIRNIVICDFLNLSDCSACSYTRLYPLCLTDGYLPKTSLC